MHRQKTHRILEANVSHPYAPFSGEGAYNISIPPMEMGRLNSVNALWFHNGFSKYLNTIMYWITYVQQLMY